MTLGKLSVAERADRKTNVAVRLVLLGLLALLFAPPLESMRKRRRRRLGELWEP
jgi:hypothetical protein